MKIVVFAGSLRKESLNKKMCRFVKNELEKNHKAEVRFLDQELLNIPLYNEDIENLSGIPAEVVNVCEAISWADAMIVSTPEYNGSIPGVLKNLVDRVSRKKPHPLSGQHLLLLACSPGALGGVRSLWHTRVPFEVLNTHVYPQMMGFPHADQIWSAEGDITNDRLKAGLLKLLAEYLEYVGSRR